MECNKASQVEAYHDNELPQSQRSVVEAHLRECGWCAALLASLRSLSQALSQAPRAEMPEGALARLREGFDVVRAKSLGERMAAERAARERGVLRIAGWLTAAAAALLMAGLVMLPATEGPGPAVVTSTRSSLDLMAAVMPPSQVQEGTPQFVQVAQWIADDLSVDVGGGDR